LEGALRGTFRDGFAFSIFSFSSRLTHLFSLDNYYTLWSRLEALSHPFASMMRFVDAYLLLATFGCRGSKFLSFRAAPTGLLLACPESFREDPDAHCLRNRKLDNVPNGILVTPEYVIDSGIYDNIDFSRISAKMEISGVIKKTMQLFAKACILLNSLIPQKGVLTSSRVRA